MLRHHKGGVKYWITACKAALAMPCTMVALQVARHADVTVPLAWDVWLVLWKLRAYG